MVAAADLDQSLLKCVASENFQTSPVGDPFVGMGDHFRQNGAAQTFATQIMHRYRPDDLQRL